MQGKLVIIITPSNSITALGPIWIIMDYYNMDYWWDYYNQGYRL
jgi:hypothetical protein